MAVFFFRISHFYTFLKDAFSSQFSEIQLSRMLGGTAELPGQRACLKMWRLCLSSRRPKVKAQQRVGAHDAVAQTSIGFHNTYQAVDRWLAAGGEGGGGEGLTTEVWLLRTLHHRAHVLKAITLQSVQTQNEDVWLWFSSSFNAYGCSVLTAKCSLLCQLYCHASCPGWTPAVYDVSKWSPKSRHFITFTGLEMKAHS